MVTAHRLTVSGTFDHTLLFFKEPPLSIYYLLKRPFQTRGQTFFVTEGQPQSDSVLRLRDSVYHKVGPRFEMVSH
jgi:hypothetical protein